LGLTFVSSFIKTCTKYKCKLKVQAYWRTIHSSSQVHVIYSVKLPLALSWEQLHTNSLSPSPSWAYLQIPLSLVGIWDLKGSLILKEGR
jgi:hypothetical protein